MKPATVLSAFALPFLAANAADDVGDATPCCDYPVDLREHPDPNSTVMFSTTPSQFWWTGDILHVECKVLTDPTLPLAPRWYLVFVMQNQSTDPAVDGFVYGSDVDIDPSVDEAAPICGPEAVGHWYVPH